MILDAGALIEKHRAKGVLLDTNLLVLYLIGNVNPARISDHKRTEKFGIDDFHLLTDLVTWFGQIYTTPHGLTQVSDLVTLPGKELTAIRNLLATLVPEMGEFFDESREVTRYGTFARLGLAGAAIGLACRHQRLVLTDDVELQLALEYGEFDALNFTHVRALDWGIV